MRVLRNGKTSVRRRFSYRLHDSISTTPKPRTTFETTCVRACRRPVRATAFCNNRTYRRSLCKNPNCKILRRPSVALPCLGYPWTAADGRRYACPMRPTCRENEKSFDPRVYFRDAYQRRRVDTSFWIVYHRRVFAFTARSSLKNRDYLPRYKQEYTNAGSRMGTSEHDCPGRYWCKGALKYILSI